MPLIHVCLKHKLLYIILLEIYIYIFSIFKILKKNFFYMVTRENYNGKIHYILPVCNMRCLNLCYFLLYP